MNPALVDIEMIERSLPLAGLTMLEVGCGDGRLTEHLVPRVGVLTSIEPDVTSLDLAKQRCAHLGRVDLRAGSGEQLEFATDSFDIILFGYSLHHQDGESALVEAIRVVRPDGHILILEPTVESEYTRLVEPFEPDEPLRLRKTLALIRSGRVDIVSEHVYTVDYEFADRPSLRRHLHDYFARDDRVSVDDVIHDILGARSASPPITVTDEVQLFLCRPRR